MSTSLESKQATSLDQKQEVKDTVNPKRKQINEESPATKKVHKNYVDKCIVGLIKYGCFMYALQKLAKLLKGVTLSLLFRNKCYSLNKGYKAITF